MRSINLLYILICLLVPFLDVGAQPLQVNVPYILEPDGKTLYIQTAFTSAAYENEAFSLAVREASAVASDLQLKENLPITKANVKRHFMSPFGYAYKRKRIGNITTTNYFYNFAAGDKFSGLTVANLEEQRFQYSKQCQVPISAMNTNEAIRLAKQWLAAAHMDIKSLDKDCITKCSISEFGNTGPVQRISSDKTCVPVYDVFWFRRGRSDALDDIAMVQLFLPTQKLLQLTVRDERYILRKALTVTNLDILLRGSDSVRNKDNRNAGNTILDGFHQ